MQVSIDDVEWDDDQRVLVGGVPFTGEVVEYDKNRKLLALTTYRNGMKDGPERLYYDDGSPQFEGNWRLGHGVGIQRRWHPNGRLKAERVYGEQGGLIEVRTWAADGTPAQ